MAFRPMWIWSGVMAAAMVVVDLAEGPTWVSAAIGCAFLVICISAAVAGIALTVAVQDEANDQYRLG